jgi:hypothetical protein
MLRRSWTVRLSHSPGLGRRRLWLVALVFGGALIVCAAVVASIPHSPPRVRGGDVVARSAPATTRPRVGTKATDPHHLLLPILSTAATPLRVVEIGDSLGIDLGIQLRSLLDARATVRTLVASVGDSGLSNISYYDWPAHLATMLTTNHPQLVVVFIGANDDQGLSLAGVVAVPGTSAWIAGYAGRVDAIVSEATNAGARVVWVGMPPMASPELNAAMGLEDAIYQRETETFPGALYVPSVPVLGNPAGLYEGTGTDESGQPVTLRTPDGVHLTPAGAALLAQTVIDAVDKRWHLSLGEQESSVPAPEGQGTPVHATA